ncbi:phosphoribosylglycinamide synthetase [Sphingosinicella sp. BN140058]|uniref:phosphoribosylglycinamide synthetase n=1 Tax=Sphingosinicella sp. BN140058 TaxID=1892855 RepID=UPI001FB1A0DA|nr:phosphoribosylglycinamide synthetase [Sphingosinicella sp. BN140058]
MHSIDDRMSATPLPLLRIADEDKVRLRILFLAKHALSEGRPDARDGSHALYHHEMLTALRSIGLDVSAADRFEDLFQRPEADFVIPLLNRGGFQNSEMLAPLLLARHDLPFLGAAPIIRGLSDDKHLMKVVASRLGVPVTPWQIVRERSPELGEPDFAWDRLVVKPNASSASWGVGIFERWSDARDHAEALAAAGHDVIFEPYAPLIDIAVPVVGGTGPWLLPATGYFPADPSQVRSYEEKRGLVPTEDDPLEQIGDRRLVEQLERHSRTLMTELWPFDYGRFEYRYDPTTGAIRFMEVNLSCNLWSRKTISRAARSLGVSHRELVETILAHSMLRQGVIDRAIAENGQDVREVTGLYALASDPPLRMRVA